MIYTDEEAVEVAVRFVTAQGEVFKEIVWIRQSPIEYLMNSPFRQNIIIPDGSDRFWSIELKTEAKGFTEEIEAECRSKGFDTRTIDFIKHYLEEDPARTIEVTQDGQAWYC